MVRDQTESSVPRVVIGRDSDKKAIVELLVASNSEENVSVLSIVGIGGLGKTTLAQLIFNDERIKNYFELKIWVCVSDPFDVKMIVRKILESATGTKSEDLELEALKSQLGNIMYSKRYLLVLDDVWNENREKWDNLKKLLEGGSSGTKILVTTRSERVAQISSTVKPYVLKALSPSESWSLFLQVALKGQEPKDSNKKTFLLPHQELYDDDDGTISIDKVILPNFKKLRVFDMDSCGIEKVPSFIKSLRHLRYLDVSRNKKITELPNFITNLQNLQVLNVFECHSLQKLPKDIKKLISLRHLYCAGCLRLHYMPRGIGQLASLQTLSMFMAATDDSVSKYAGGLDEMDTLNNLRGSLEIRKLGHGTINPNLKEKPLLQSLILHFDDNLYVHREETASCLQPHSNLKELEVWAYRGFSFPSWVSSLTNAVIIRIFHCSKCQHLPPLHQLPSLQYLELIV
ncbi:hypothetical protein GH714_016946 [Hevea brasiliensis]|uniref:Uncharacterized protein n=1 Tax=Hevea brasiliensis TaxID=3981 RepID=A0A6A6N1K6_HEVBR|nr:hypothetical protein GH714_016946 [Hevea brasiliensis]